MTDKRVLPVALDGDAGDDLAFAVQFRDAAPLVGGKLDTRHVAQQHGRAAFGLQHDAFEIGGAAQIAAAAHHELGFGKLDDAAAHVHVGLLRMASRIFVSGMSKRLEAARIDHDGVLAHEAADARDLGHAFRLGEARSGLASPASSAARPACAWRAVTTY